MFRKTLYGAFVVAAAAGTALLVKVIKDMKDREEENREDDDEIHFIQIEDGNEEETVTYDASEKSDEVQQVCAVYPYLDPDYVEELLAKNHELNTMYENDTLVQITHEVSFESHQNLETFLDVMETAGYYCVVGSKYEMTATKKLFTEEGALISDILNVANQTAALHGKYLGQKINK